MTKNKKITFLLGAGASSPFIISKDECLSSSYITNALFEPDRWRKVIETLNIYRTKRRNTDSYLDKIDNDDILFVLNRINDKLQNNRYFDNVNFEYIIHLLDKVADYLRAHMINEISNIDEILIDFWAKIDPVFIHYVLRKSDPDGWHYVPFLAREVVIDSIIGLWHAEPESLKDRISLNETFYSNLLAKFQSVNLYSLNYDPLLHEALKNVPLISTGFEKDKGFQSDNFFRNNSILAFVHGQIGFEPAGNNMKLNDNYSNAQRNRIEGIFGNTPQSTQYWNVGMKGVHYNTYLVTGLDKIDGFSKNPFASYIHRFGKDIIESEYVILVGISLNDYHLNSFLTNVIFVSSKAKKILFVTKAKTNSIKQYLSGNGDNVLFKLWTLSQDTVTGKVHPGRNPIDAFENHLNNLYTSLECKGYGMLTNYVLLYIRGAEKFYSEKDIEVLWRKASAT